MNSLVGISQSIVSSANLSHGWVCYPKSHSVRHHGDRFVHPIYDFSSVPLCWFRNPWSTRRIVYWVQLVHLLNEAVTPSCFYLGLPFPYFIKDAFEFLESEGDFSYKRETTLLICTNHTDPWLKESHAEILFQRFCSLCPRRILPCVSLGKCTMGIYCLWNKRTEANVY